MMKEFWLPEQSRRRKLSARWQATDESPGSFSSCYCCAIKERNSAMASGRNTSLHSNKPPSLEVDLWDMRSSNQSSERYIPSNAPSGRQILLLKHLKECLNSDVGVQRTCRWRSERDRSLTNLRSSSNSKALEKKFDVRVNKLSPITNVPQLIVCWVFSTTARCLGCDFWGYFFCVERVLDCRLNYQQMDIKQKIT